MSQTLTTTAKEHEIREELGRVLESPSFRTSKRCREFLEYIVEQTVKGPGDTLKERSIGVELFQLPPDFDTGQHTIVRVTASEVRKKLAQHYVAENGSHHAVKLELPPGSYSADFKWAPEPTEAVPEPEPTKRKPWFVLAAVLLAGVSLLAVFLVSRSAPAAKATTASAPVTPVATASSGDFRIAVGASGSYIDRSGRAWGSDRFFTGGSVSARPSERIFRTLDPDLYRRIRLGDFRYDIPLQPGSYELHLHFAETSLMDSISTESSGEGQRLFRVDANGKRILDTFDVVADAAGANVADERVFRNITPAEDGRLHLNFQSFRGAAMLSGIEALPVSPGKVRPVRIRSGWTSSWQDSDGQAWRGDSYFQGGNALVRNMNPVRERNEIAHDASMYTSERWGHFSYAIPVAEGRYRVTLRFVEGHYGHGNSGFGGAGSRKFDVYSNGVALLRDFDIFQEAGGEGRPIQRTFGGIRPTAQGKIVLTFVPVKGMACVSGIEVVEEP